MKSFESITEMNVKTPALGDNCNRFGIDTMPIRVLAVGAHWPDGGTGWVLVRQVLDSSGGGRAFPGDCLLIESGDLAVISVDELRRTGLPLVAAMLEGSGPIDAALADSADGFVLEGDDAAVMGTVFARAVAGAPAMQVRELSDGTARTINALSAETSRIADALARLAAAQRSGGADAQPVDAALVRRQLQVRTVMNLLGPCVNPARPPVQLLGVADPRLLRRIAQTLSAMGVRDALVVHGSGLDEIALHAETRAIRLTDGEMEELELTPEQAGLDRAPLLSVTGGDVAENAARLQALLTGHGERAENDIVAINAGALLWVAGKAKDLKQGTDAALDALRTGEAGAVLAVYVEASRS